MDASCQTYTGGYCAQYVNYPIYITPGSSVEASEKVLKTGGMDLLLGLNESVPADRPCESAFLQWACYTAYPSCKDGQVDQVPCQSVCQNAVQQCTSLFTMFGKASTLPNCASNVQNLNLPYGSGSSCLGAESSSSVTVASPPGKCEAYTSGYCSHWINYPVFVADNNPPSAIESTLKAGGMDLLLQLNATSTTYTACVNAFLEWACLSAYPSCETNTISSVTCQSVCNNAVSQCTSMFTTFGKQNTLPNCDGNVLSWNTTYASDSSICLGSSKQSTPPPPTPTNVTCPSFLIPNPSYNISNPSQILPSIPGQTCAGSCCIPCPLILQFYDMESMSTMFDLSMMAAFLSTFGSAFTFISYIIFPKKRGHPTNMMFYFSGGCMFLHAFQAASAGGTGLQISCVDDITEAVVGNSIACPVQSFFLHLTGVYCTCWIALFMINLNLTIVWRKDWFSEHYTKIHVFIVIWALVPAIGIIASKGVRNVGFFCLFDVDHAWWFLVFFGVSGWPGVTITMVTVIAIVRMLLSAPNQRIKQRMTNSGRTSSNTCPSHQQTGGVILELKASPLPRNSENVTTSKEESMVTPIKSQNMTNSLADLVTSTAQSQAVNVASKLKEHRDKVWGLLIKSWRSIAISLALVMMYGGFWTFNLVAVMMMKGVGTDTPWVRNWYACVLQGNSREVCASLAVSFTPPVGFMIYANVAVNLIGFSSFLIFGLGMIDDWKQLLGLKK